MRQSRHIFQREFIKTRERNSMIQVIRQQQPVSWNAGQQALPQWMQQLSMHQLISVISRY